ncbi:unnamed protein product, partial [Laminaria digitata]
SSPPSKRTSAAARPGGRRAGSSATESRRSKKSSLGSSVGESVNGGDRAGFRASEAEITMGGMCSSNKTTSVVRSNKENFGDPGAGEGSSQTACAAATTGMLEHAPGDLAFDPSGKGKQTRAGTASDGNGQQASRAQQENDLLDSTAFLSPDPEGETAAATREGCAGEVCFEEDKGGLGEGADRS